MKKLELVDIENYIKQHSLMPYDKLHSFLQMLKHSGPDMLIYPGYIMKELDIRSNIVFQIMSFMKDRCLLKEEYELKCPECNNYYIQIFQKQNEITKVQKCDRCGHKFDAFKDRVVVYRLN